MTHESLGSAGSAYVASRHIERPRPPATADWGRRSAPRRRLPSRGDDDVVAAHDRCRFRAVTARARRPKLTDIVAALERRYGPPAPPAVTDPWEQIVLENASYLVDDERRRTVFERLRERVGLSSEAILAAPRARLVAAIRDGGMKPPMRADKLLDAARIAQDVGAPLAEIVRRPFDDARKVLKRFPGIGAPGAEKVALFAGALPVVALESNGLRALVRVGFGVDRKYYAQTWREVRAAVDREAPRDIAWCVAAHQLLRRHGQETCRQSAPLCPACVLSATCPSAVLA